MMMSRKEALLAKLKELRYEMLTSLRNAEVLAGTMSVQYDQLDRLIKEFERS